MASKYIGQKCTHCGQKLAEHDVIAICGTCHRAVHRACWQNARQCPTKGCLGTIEAMICLDDEQDNRPAYNDKKEKFDVLYNSKQSYMQSNAPLVVDQLSIIKNNDTDDVFAKVTFCSLSAKPISAICISIHCSNVWGVGIEGVENYNFLDLNIQKGMFFGSDMLIPLADKETRQIEVVVKKVKLADGELVTCGENVEEVPSANPLSEQLESDDITNEYIRVTSERSQYCPGRGANTWRCSCGCVNLASDKTCCSCGSDIKTLTEKFDKNKLKESLLKYQQQRKDEEAYQSYLAQQAERFLEKEQERKREEIKLAKQRKKKKTRKIMGIIAVICTILCAVTMFAYVISQTETQRYKKAVRELEKGDYLTAYTIFCELKDYSDAEVKAEALLIEWVKKALTSKDDYLFNQLNQIDEIPEQHREIVYNEIKYFMQQEENALLIIKKYYRVTTLIRKLPVAYKDTYAMYQLSGGGMSLLGTSDLFIKQRELVKQYWFMYPHLKTLASMNVNIEEFLNDVWVGGAYYISFSGEAAYGYYPAPAIGKPSWAKKMVVEDMICYWSDGGNKRSEPVYGLEIIDFNKIRVYCYADGNTYIFTRK